MKNLQDIFIECIAEMRSVHIPVQEDKIINIESANLDCMGECECEYQGTGYLFKIRIKKELLKEPVDIMELKEVIVHELIHTCPRCISHWSLWNKEEKMGKDSARTACHDSVIVKFNMLERFLKMKGKAARWREILGYEENDLNFRKRIGDFACYLVFVNSLLAR